MFFGIGTRSIRRQVATRVQRIASDSFFEVIRGSKERSSVCLPREVQVERNGSTYQSAEHPGKRWDVLWGKRTSIGTRVNTTGSGR